MNNVHLLLNGWRAVHRQVIVLIFAAFTLAACTDSPAAVSKPAQVMLNFLTPATVRSVVVEVSGPGLSPSTVLNIPVGADSVARGTLTVTAGAGRRFMMTAFDSAGVATHHADTTIALVAGANALLAMRLAPLASSLGITVTFGGYRLTIADTSTRRVVVGGTVSLNATLLDPAGNALPRDSIRWASGNPAVASVSEGVVRAVRPGTAVIAGTFRGATARVGVAVVTEGSLVAWYPFDVLPQDQSGNGNHATGVSPSLPADRLASRMPPARSM